VRGGGCCALERRGDADDDGDDDDGAVSSTRSPASAVPLLPQTVGRPTGRLENFKGVESSANQSGGRRQRAA
jgi:hypothetical protein